jgi:hypothetical protein
MNALPDPEVQPLLRPPDLIGVIPNLGRSAIYDAISRGDIPSIRVGGRLYIPTALLRQAWGLDLKGS